MKKICEKDKILKRNLLTFSIIYQLFTYIRRPYHVHAFKSRQYIVFFYHRVHFKLPRRSSSNADNIVGIHKIHIYVAEHFPHMRRWLDLWANSISGIQQTLASQCLLHGRNCLLWAQNRRYFLVWMFTLTNNNNNGIEFVHVGACLAPLKEKMKIAKI